MADDAASFKYVIDWLFIPRYTLWEMAEIFSWHFVYVDNSLLRPV